MAAPGMPSHDACIDIDRVATAYEAEAGKYLSATCACRMSATRACRAAFKLSQRAESCKGGIVTSSRRSKPTGCWVLKGAKGDGG